MVHQSEQTAATQTTWTPEEIAARRDLWAAVATRLARRLPADGAFQAAVEAEVGFTLAELQRAISGQLIEEGPPPAAVQAVQAVQAPRCVGVTYGCFDGPGGDRDRGGGQNEALAA